MLQYLSLVANRRSPVGNPAFPRASSVSISRQGLRVGIRHKNTLRRNLILSGLLPSLWILRVLLSCRISLPVKVYQATDFRNTDAAREILKEINVVMDLSKKMRLKLGATSEPVKPLEKPSAGFVKDELVKPSEKLSAGPVTEEPVKPTEKPSAGPVKDEPVKPSEKPSADPVKKEPTEPVPAGENNQAPGVSQTTIPPNDAGVGAPVVKHDNSEAQK